MNIIVGGFKLDQNKRVLDSLRRIYGIGKNKSKQIVSLLGVPISSNYKLNEVDYERIIQFDKIVVHYVHGYQAKRNMDEKIKLLVSIKSYRGIRHMYFLSVRGQKTHKNAKTQREKKNQNRKKIKKKNNK